MGVGACIFGLRAVRRPILQAFYLQEAQFYDRADIRDLVHFLHDTGREMKRAVGNRICDVVFRAGPSLPFAFHFGAFRRAAYNLGSTWRDAPELGPVWKGHLHWMRHSIVMGSKVNRTIINVITSRPALIGAALLVAIGVWRFIRYHYMNSLSVPTEGVYGDGGPIMEVTQDVADGDPRAWACPVELVEIAQTTALGKPRDATILDMVKRKATTWCDEKGITSLQRTEYVAAAMASAMVIGRPEQQMIRASSSRAVLNQHSRLNDWLDRSNRPSWRRGFWSLF